MVKVEVRIHDIKAQPCVLKSRNFRPAIQICQQRLDAKFLFEKTGHSCVCTAMQLGEECTKLTSGDVSADALRKCCGAKIPGCTPRGPGFLEIILQGSREATDDICQVWLVDDRDDRNGWVILPRDTGVGIDMRHQLAAKGFPVFHRLRSQEDGGFELIHFVTGNIPAHIEVCLDDNAGLTASRNEIVEALQIAIHIEEVVVVMNAQGVVA